MVKIFLNNLVDLPTSLSLSYLWCVGFMLSFFMVLQVLSGVVLSFFYSSSLNFELLMLWTDDSLFNWFIRYLHIWGVSVIFFLLYIHIARSLYYSSYSKLGVWNVGFFLYILLMVEAFLGYVLPWHQMSYWAATVLTSVILSIPLLGSTIYYYVIGGYSVSVTETLIRVFPVHVLLGLVLLLLIGLHLFYLHKSGSSSPLYVVNSYSDCLYFHSYYSVKDIFVFVLILFIMLSVMLISPNLVLDVEAFVEANPMVTPVNIKPEWYFLIYYAVLRSVESKVGGLIMIILLLLVLWVPSLNQACIYSLGRQLLFWFIVGLFIVMSYFGGCHAEYPFIIASKLGSVLLLILLSVFKIFWSSPHWIDFRWFNLD
uniref:Cytochrome b n=1 Tax=Schistosoma turkestanicum TaxID=1163369 RepID=G4WCQ1_9TREM|nr:cytochrome b [Schistosoma turkestanicum]